MDAVFHGQKVFLFCIPVTHGESDTRVQETSWLTEGFEHDFCLLEEEEILVALVRGNERW